MAGLIREDVLERVRERVRIEDVVSTYLTLRPAGSDSLKGLCPFHDERTPSFHVRPSRNLWHCFGCGEGGDLIDFVRRIEHLGFADAVELLAKRAGIAVEYQEGGKRRENTGQRQRLVDANQVAQEFYARQLESSPAQVARSYLAGRGFDRDVCVDFGVGFAPQGWSNLTDELHRRGFRDEEIIAAGLASRSNRGTLYDRFRGRIVWPIRDRTGVCVGFGARRIFEDDNGPKYLNSPETSLYKKSSVLYGLDRARRHIGHKRQVVIVEGYTDVMAAHLAGVDTAVATCGTAFGAGHVQILRQFLVDSADPAAGVRLVDGRSRGGEIIFTFDGDEAGQKAALRAFMEEQSFASQTFVAVAQEGMDPCDLRLARGDQAVRDLIDSRVPLFEFVIRTALQRENLSTAEGRVRALNACTPIIAHIRDYALRSEYGRVLAGWLGMDEREVYRAIKFASRRSPARLGGTGGPGLGGERAASGRVVASADPAGRSLLNVAAQSVGNEGDGAQLRLPHHRDHLMDLQHQVLQGVLQLPHAAVGSAFDELDQSYFPASEYGLVREVIRAVGGVQRFHELWVESEKRHGVSDEAVREATINWHSQMRSRGGEYLDGALTELMVQPIPVDRPELAREWVLSVIKALMASVLVQRESQLRIRMQQLDESSEEYDRCFRQLLAYDRERRGLQSSP